MLTHWSNLNRFLHDFNDISDRLATVPTARVHARSSWAAADIVETDESLTLTLDVPGLRSDDIDLVIEDGVLQITGGRQRLEHEGGVTHRQERRFGTFNRSFRLGSSLDPSGTTAGVVDGVLTVTIPKSAEGKPLRIEVV